MTGLKLGALCADLARVYGFGPGSGEGQLVTRKPGRSAWVVSLVDEAVGEFAQFEVDDRAVAGYQDEATASLVGRLFRTARAEVDARVTAEEPWAPDREPPKASAIQAALLRPGLGYPFRGRAGVYR